jgi:sugar/nucleoside kinase (ribokinase family)
MMADVICVGLLVADAVARPVVEIPDKGKLSLVDDLQLHTGGCAANTGAALAKLGVSTVVVGKVGQDGFGDFMVQALSKSGLDVSGISRSADYNTSASLVLVDKDGERSFIHSFGANQDLTDTDVPDSVLEGGKILHVAGTFLMPKLDGEPTGRLLKRARDLGRTTSLDTAWDAQGRWGSVLLPVLEYIDIFLPSIEEAKMIAGLEKPEEIASFFLDRGVKIVGLKMGSEGSYVRSATEEYWIPPYKVEAVDATGAGDSFVAGFLAGVVHGWDLERTGKLANAVGASCVTGLGATGGIRSWEETVRFMETGKWEY